MAEKREWDIVERTPMGKWSFETKAKIHKNGEVTINEKCLEEDGSIKEENEVTVRKELIQKIQGTIVERDFMEEQSL